MQSMVKNINGINITVDYRTELLGILMWLSGYTTKLPHLFSEYENKFYTDEIVEKFSKYKNEEAVLKFKELVDKHNFSYDAPFSLFLQLDEHFKCDNLNDYTFKERLQNDESVYEFINGLDDFANKINFNEYYNSKR